MPIYIYIYYAEGKYNVCTSVLLALLLASCACRETFTDACTETDAHRQIRTDAHRDIHRCMHMCVDQMRADMAQESRERET